MLKKTITYQNYNGETTTEDLYFNLNKVELLNMELEYPNGLSGYVESIVKAEDVASIMALFKRIIYMSYGVKTPDGKRFIKSAQLTEEFMQTEAYSELFVMLATDADAATAFIKGVIPQNLNGQQPQTM